MSGINDFLKEIPEYTGIIVLMFSTFLIGYLLASFFENKKYQAQIRKMKRQANLSKAQNKTKDIDVIFSEIKPRIIEVVKETQKGAEKKEQQSQPSEPIEVPPINKVKTPQEIAESARTSYLSYTKNKPELNFENFGYASKEEKEDLTQINGIGPYIEQRLNEIGIYNYEQISRLKEEDIRILTELIDFFPGRIERDNWCAQAEALLKH